MESQKSQSWSFSSTPEASSKATQAVEETAVSWGVDHQWAMRLNLVVEELFLNTVHHGSKPDETTDVKITLVREGRNLTLTYEDKAPPFNPLEHVTEEDPSERIGGRGNLLVKGMADQSHYERRNPWNILTLKFDLEGE